MNETLYQIAHEGAIIVDRSDLGLLKLTGETRTDLIHRMSTQDLRGMQVGEGRATVLTTEIGRIIDRVILFDAGDAAFMLTSENNADNIARYLLRFVFFNDDFQIEPITDRPIWGVYGSGAAALLQKSGYLTGELPLYGWQNNVHRIDPVAGDGYLLVDDARATLIANGAVEADDATFDYLRIEAGRPRFGHELTDSYIPLETGLWDDISFSKGCYVGQEIIARMESRGKLAKQMVALSADGVIVAGDAVIGDGKTVGAITSAAAGTAGLLALGYIKTAALENKTPLTTANGVSISIR